MDKFVTRNKPDMRLYLSESAWLDSGLIPGELLSDKIFGGLWEAHPESLGVVQLYGRLVKTPRYQQVYDRPYYFSGMTHPCKPLPEAVKPFKVWADELTYGHFNSVLLNWYRDGFDYISKHSDNEQQLERNSEILSISLGATRKFRIRRKSDNEVIKEVPLHHGTFVVMGGTFQTDFTHEVPKITGKLGTTVGRRINITMRKFKE